MWSLKQKQMNKLRVARIIIAAVFFVAALGTLINIFPSDSIAQYALELQFTPAVMGILTGSFALILILLAITLLFGRAYCSFICPLGIFQDIIHNLSGRILKKTNKDIVKKNSGYKKPHNILRYSILAFVLISLAIGLTLPLSLLDPYSIMGKISNNVIVNLNNALNNLFSLIAPETFYYQEYVKWSIYSFIYSLLALDVIVAVASIKGRLYCNSICPVGTFLGMIGECSLFKIVINKEMCVKCSQCSKNCKSNCIDLEKKEIDYNRCVVCFNCITSCKRGGVKYVPFWKKGDNDKKESNTGRRNALIAIGGLASAVAVRKYGKLDSCISGKTSPKNTPILPPGSLKLEAFKNACTSCHACIEACPKDIIKPASFEYGIDGIMLPTIKYNNGYCKFNCNACSQVCPNESIQKISLEEKQKTKIGLAVFIAENCISKNEGIDCGACSSECPVQAITMVKDSNNPSIEYPSINPDKCIGCGACEYRCPALPKAIKVNGIL